ncbi:MAG TPA: hypothetical protein VMY38_06865 [Gemmatimonadaceae bacterium]|nr:hypothetical protein [Gemmatimonadaceae bacterium]
MRRVLLLAIVLGACAPSIRPIPRTQPAAPMDELPPLAVEEVSVVTAAPQGAPAPVDQPRVTLHASQADVRVLIPALAQIAGVSVVMDSTVRGTVAVRFENVPAIEALHTVIEFAGMGIEGPPEAPWAPAVFHHYPVNINVADAEVIRARFNVSRKLAEWIVTSRTIDIPERK